MNKIVNKALLASLLLGAAAGHCTNTRAAEQPQGSQPAPQKLSAKIIVVDRALKALTVDVKGTIRWIRFNPTAKVRKDGKETSLTDLVPGQTVELLTRTDANGTLEIVGVDIEPQDAQTEAAGRDGKKRKEREHRDRRDRGNGAPPVFSQPPINNRPPVSPHN